MYLYGRWNDHGDAHAKNYLIRACRRYAISIALMYCRYELPLAELIATGELGFLRALEAFDAQRDRRFLTYAAYRIRLCILEHVLCRMYDGAADSAFSPAKTIRKLRLERARVTIMLDGLHGMDQRHADVKRGGVTSFWASERASDSLLMANSTS
jgi:RNA polymerase sigma-32 factor